MQHVFVSNAVGNTVDPANWSQPVLASGQVLTATNKNTDYELTVEAGKRYIVANKDTGYFFLGLADVTTDANKLWLVPKNAIVGIIMPAGYTTLHYGSDTDAAGAHIAKIKDVAGD